MAKIFVVDREHDADVKCFKVDREYNADLLVYVVDREYNAKSDELWFYVSKDRDATTGFSGLIENLMLI